VGRVNILGKKSAVSPAEYKSIDGMNASGRFQLAQHQSASSCVFSKSQRQGIVEKTILGNPGPGA